MSLTGISSQSPSLDKRINESLWPLGLHAYQYSGCSSPSIILSLLLPLDPNTHSHLQPHSKTEPSPQGPWSQGSKVMCEPHPQGWHCSLPRCRSAAQCQPGLPTEASGAACCSITVSDIHLFPSWWPSSSMSWMNHPPVFISCSF